ncbi:MAG: hypothetical protein EOO38_31730, partial [Cytophagaceae bacterium]
MKLPVNRVWVAGALSCVSTSLLVSCGVTAAQDEPLAPVAQIQPLPVSVAQNKHKLPRALWVWDATVITNTKQGQNLFDFCAKKYISVIYLSVGDIFAPTPLEATDPKHITAPMLGKFLAMAHAKNIEVESLDGDPEFALQGKHAEALGRLQKAIAYNKAVAQNERLDGFQWDTEPYLLPQFNQGPEAQRSVFKQYLDGAAQMRDALKASPTMPTPWRS